MIEDRQINQITTLYTGNQHNIVNQLYFNKKKKKKEKKKMYFGVCLVVLMVKNLPAVQETAVHSLVQEDPLEKGTVTHTSIFAWRNAWTKELGKVQSMESHRVRHNCGTKHTVKAYFQKQNQKDHFI